jgi:anti-anti-sigma regulatory factor
VSALVSDVQGEVFSTSSTVSGKSVLVTLQGCLDLETAPALERFLATLSAPVTSGILREVEFDIQGLYLMSSSSISHMASWLKRLKAVAPSTLIKFRTNANLAWQRRTLESIRRVAEAMVSVV